MFPIHSDHRFDPLPRAQIRYPVAAADFLTIVWFAICFWIQLPFHDGCLSKQSNAPPLTGDPLFVVQCLLFTLRNSLVNVYQRSRIELISVQ
jgi:hypothetical protein